MKKQCPNMVWALEQRGLKAADRLILIYLANMANGSLVCWPSLPTIAADLELSPRTVHTSVHRLAVNKLIEITAKPRTVNHYRINRPTNWTPKPAKSARSEDGQAVHNDANIAALTPAKHANPAISSMQDLHDYVAPAPTVPANQACNPRHSELAKLARESTKEEPLKEEESPVLRTEATAIAIASPKPPPSIRDLLWKEGREICRRLTGKTYSAAGSQIGVFLKDANQNCQVVLDVLKAAEREGPHDAVSWVRAGIKCRMNPEPRFKTAAVELMYHRGLLTPEARREFADGLTTDFSDFEREMASG